MESAKTLEVVLHYGTDLRDVKHLSPMDPYAIVWVAVAGAGKESKQTTPIAKNGACNPKWECCMRFNIISMSTDYTLFFQIKHCGILFDRRVGEVQVRFADLLAGDTPARKVRYQVTTPSGEKRGEIIVSHKFSELVASSDEDDDIVANELSGDLPREKKREKAKKIAKRVAEKIVCGGLELAAGIALNAAIDSD
ncbi:hypothetical protein LXL04_014934 [Taraxacum kok-saghyz]